MTHRRVVAAGLAVVLLGAAPPAPAFPDTASGRAAAAILAALAGTHADRAAAVATLFDPHLDAERTTHVLDRLAEECAGCRAVATTASRSGEAVETILEAPALHRFAKLMLQSPGGGRVARFGLDPVPDPAATPLPWLPAAGDRAVAAEIDRHVRAAADAGRFSGVVRVERGGALLYERAYGYADAARTRPLTPRTRLLSGSMAKMFTAVTIARLIEDGKLRFDETLAEALPDFPNHDAATRITLAQLLAHRSGLGDYFGPRYLSHPERYATLAAIVAAFGNDEPLFAPGTQVRYSNLGYVALGAVIERAAGKPYVEAVRDAVLRPAGMDTATPDAAPLDAAPLTYADDDPMGLQPRTAVTEPHLGTSAGGWRTTARDYTRFADALLHDRLIGAAMRRRLWTSSAPAPDARFSFGYGFGIERLPPVTYGHNGGSPGSNGMLQIAPERGTVVSVLANVDAPAADDLAHEIVRYVP